MNRINKRDVTEKVQEEANKTAPVISSKSQDGSSSGVSTNSENGISQSTNVTSTNSTSLAIQENSTSMANNTVTVELNEDVNKSVKTLNNITKLSDAKQLSETNQSKLLTSKQEKFIWDFAETLRKCDNTTLSDNLGERSKFIRQVMITQHLGKHNTKPTTGIGKYCHITESPFIKKHSNVSVITKNFPCIGSVNSSGLHVTFVNFTQDFCMSLDVKRHRQTFVENATCIKLQNQDQNTPLLVRQEVISCIKHKNHTGASSSTQSPVPSLQLTPAGDNSFSWLSFLFGLVLGVTATATVVTCIKKRQKKRRGFRLSEFESRSDMTLEIDENRLEYEPGEWRRTMNPSPIM